MSLDQFSTASLRAIFRAAAIGLTLHGEAAGDGPGSDRQLLRKMRQVTLALRSRAEGGDEPRRRKVMEDNEHTERQETQGGDCLYPECRLRARREGLCIKHLAVLVHGDKDAAGAVRKHYTLRAAADATAERKDEMHTCEKCGKSFKSGHGLDRHRGWCGRTATAKARPRQTDAPAGAANDGNSAAGEDGKACRVPGCGRQRKSRGLCEMHLFRIFKGKDEALRAEAMKYLLAPRHPGPGSRRRAPCGEPSKAAAEPPKPGANVGPSDDPPDGIAAAGHVFLRLAELLGLAEGIADFPCPGGHGFLVTATGKMAILRPDGQTRSARFIVES